MFTGIVTEMGTVRSVAETETGRRLEIAAPATVRSLGIGDSVAVDGVCLTVVSIGGDRFAVEAVDETLGRTTLGAAERGDRVDLERPVAAAGGRFDGHIVQGHVDGVGSIVAVDAEGEAGRIRISVPEGLAPYLVEKGSITVDGVSLTVTAVSPLRTAESWFEIVLIPHTLDITVLGGRGPGDRVNLEADVIAKYVERWMEART
jgi:riboflavin synthase